MRRENIKHRNVDKIERQGQSQTKTEAHGMTGGLGPRMGWGGKAPKSAEV